MAHILVRMTTLLKIFSALTLLTLGLATVTGYMATEVIDPGTHVFIGLLSALGAILLLTIVMSWFMVTGAAVRKRRKADGTLQEEYRLTQNFKKRLFPFTTSAILLLMVVPALGAAYDTGEGPLLHHTLAAWATILCYIFTHGRLRKTLDENEALLKRLVQQSGEEKDQTATQ